MKNFLPEQPNSLFISASVIMASASTASHILKEFFSALAEGASEDDIAGIVEGFDQCIREAGYCMIPIQTPAVGVDAGAPAGVVVAGEKKHAPASAAQLVAQHALIDRSKDCAATWKTADKKSWNEMAKQLEPVEGAKRATNGWNLYYACRGDISKVPALNAAGVRVRVVKAPK